MKTRTQTVNDQIEDLAPASKKGKDDQGGVPKIEEVREAVKILSAQCGIPRIRNPNKKTIMAFLDHHHPGKSYPEKDVAEALLVLISPYVGNENREWIQAFLGLAIRAKAREIKREETQEQITKV